MDENEIAHSWREFAETECGTYSPLYAAIARAVADDPELIALTAAAPPSGQQPNVLLAAAHDLLLSGVQHPLAGVYAGHAAPEEAPSLFRDLCLSHRPAVQRLLATRHTQTNEPGRAALLAVGLGVAAGRLGERVALLDAGCSAGLNLLLDRYRFDYGPAGTLGPADSPVRIACAARGPVPVPPRLPDIADRRGLDRAPVDVTDPEDARWLLACVWPDTGRLPRTAAAIELARADPPRLIAGDMVTDLDAALDTLDPAVPVVVVTTSACGYLTVEQRHAFVDVLTRRARHQAIAWLTTDPPGVIDLLPPIAAEPGDTLGTVLGLVTFDTGVPVGRSLGLGQSHGAWLAWTHEPDRW